MIQAGRPRKDRSSRGRSGPGTPTCCSQNGAGRKLSSDFEGASLPLGAAAEGGRMPRNDFRSHRAGIPVSDAAQGIRPGQRSKIRGRSRPAGHNGRLGQQQQQRHGHDDYQSQSRGQDCAGSPFPTVRALPSTRRQLAAAVSLRVEARAVRVQGTEAPRGPPTRSVTVTLSHSPSVETTAEADAPERVRTTLCTVAESSPRANARAPARAPSSSRSWVAPAAAPARSMASSSRTAGSVTANSAVTAPCDPTNRLLRLLVLVLVRLL